MDRVDKLIQKALKKNKFLDLSDDNPYKGKTFDELINMLRYDALVKVPENGTYEKDQYNIALLEACANRKKYDIITKADKGEDLGEAEKDIYFIGENPVKKEDYALFKIYKEEYLGIKEIPELSAYEHLYGKENYIDESEIYRRYKKEAISILRRLQKILEERREKEADPTENGNPAADP